MSGGRFGAIDIGTNTVRLLVAELLEDGRLAHVDRRMLVTRLGKGVDANARLDPPSARRTLVAVEEFARAVRDAGAELVRVAGTSALRDAAGSDEFVREVGEIVGRNLEILTGEMEARLAFAGAASDLPGGPAVVCDIGGGSTELVTEGAACSLDLGSVRLKERCLPSDPPSQEEVLAARRLIDEKLEAAGPPGLRGDEELVGVAGTVTTLAALAGGLQEYDPDLVHHSRLTAADVSAWSARLLSLPSAEIDAFGAVAPGRADVLAAGVLILESVMGRWGYGSVLVSERDILDGLILDAVRRGRID